MGHVFIADAMNKSNRRNRIWYQKNLLHVLEIAKEKQVRDIDTTIALGQELIKVLNEKVDLPVVVPLRDVKQSDDDSLMKPIEPEILDILYGSTEKGADRLYLNERYKKFPEDKFFFRIVTSWDYGWQQKLSRVPARSVNHGRCAILRDTFYRKNNLAPDPPNYAQPSGGEVSICSEYSCHFN